jgi:plastocyanin
MASVLVLAAPFLRGDRVTLPAVASIVGGAPFFSDVRVFNTSYTSPLSVTASYRCFIPSPCVAGTPEVAISLAPRQSKSFDDMVAHAFAAPNTAGGVEFDFDGSENQLVVTSRLYSTEPTPTVGMFVAGLEPSKAGATTVLTSIRNGGPVQGFRTNVGFFNPNDSSVSVTVRIFDQGAPLGNPVTQTAAAHAGFQFNGIFGMASVPSAVTSNAVVVATATAPVFTYAAVIDNHTTDPIFVVGAPDQPAQQSVVHSVHVGQGGTFFVDQVSGTAVTTVNVGDTVTWTWEGTLHHGTNSGTCSGGGGGGGYGYGGGCTSSGKWDSNIHQAPFSYSYTFTQAGTFPYFCDVHLDAMTGRVIVNATAAPARAKPGSTTR